MVARKYTRRSRKNVLSRKASRPLRKKTYGKKKISLRKRASSSNALISRFTRYRAPSRYVKFMSNIAATDLLYNNYCGRVATSFGYSSIFAVSMLGSGGFVSAAGGFDNELGQIQYRINGAASGNDVRKTTKFCVKQCKGQLRIVNQDSGPVQIVLYDIVAKRDSGISPQTAIVNGLQNEAAQAFSTTTMPPGISPTHSLDFNQYFKVVGTRKMTLSQGRTHTHHVDLTPNRIINSELLEEGNLNIAGLTYWCLIHVTGFVVNSVTNPGTEQTYGSAAIDVAMTKMTHYTFMNDITSNLYLNTVPSIVLTGGENIMNEGTGTATLGITA